MKAKQLQRKKVRDSRKELRRVWRKIQGRPKAQGRVCGECQVCNREVPCAWREGLLDDHHRPDQLGILVDARVLPGNPSPIVVTVVRELAEGSGVLESEDGLRIVGAFGSVTPTIVAKADGTAVQMLRFPDGFEMDPGASEQP
jgi:hypothetical protein